MSLTIGDNFSYQGAKPLDARLTYATIAEMKSKADSTLYDGIMAFCKADGKNYQWKSTNEVDATLGKWRQFESGASVTVDDELSETSTNPVQNAVIKEALDGKADLVDGKVPAAQLPSYVDDVLEYEDRAHFPATGEAGKIYVALDTNKTYRWSGSAYTEISESLALGETSSTAYRGDRGKIAYDDSQANKAAIGDLTELETTEKSDLVSAINEANSGGYTAGDGIDITNKEIKTKNMSSDDMSEVASPMPGVMSRRMKYSLQEQVVGEWIDGKPIYQKTIDFGALPNNTVKTIAHGISNLKRVIHTSTTWTQQGTYSGSLEVMGGDSTAGVDLYVDATNISITTSTDSSNRSVYITLQYTKTTDTAS